MCQQQNSFCTRDFCFTTNVLLITSKEVFCEVTYFGLKICQKNRVNFPCSFTSLYQDLTYTNLKVCITNFKAVGPENTCTSWNFYCFPELVVANTWKRNIYVTAVGWRAGNTRFTFVLLAGVGSGLCTHRVITVTRSVTVMNTISILWVGMH